MTRTGKIITALRTLDQSNDAHWESDGRPKLEIVRNASGIPDLTYNQIDTAVAVARLTRQQKVAMLDAHNARVNKRIAALNELKDKITPKRIPAVGDLLTLNRWSEDA
jgi:hypothetical protein